MGRQPHVESFQNTSREAATAIFSGAGQLGSTHSNLIYHIVFSTKFRQPLIQEHRDRLYEYIGGVVRQQNGVLLEIGGMPDHVHLLVRFGLKLAISDVLRVVKSNSSKWYNETFRPSVPFGWQRGFGAFSVSESSIDAVRRYIQNQENHHRDGVSFEDEYRSLLNKHGVAFDERYLFEDGP